MACGMFGSGLLPFLKIIAYLLKTLGFVIPFILIVLIVIDISKIVLSADDKNNSKITSTIVKRLIYAIVIFLIPFVIKLTFKFLNDSVNDGYANPTSWISCFESLM